MAVVVVVAVMMVGVGIIVIKDVIVITIKGINMIIVVLVVVSVALLVPDVIGRSGADVGGDQLIVTNQEWIKDQVASYYTVKFLRKRETLHLDFR